MSNRLKRQQYYQERSIGKFQSISSEQNSTQWITDIDYQNRVQLNCCIPLTMIS